MDYLGEHIDNKFGGCDVPFVGKVSEVIPAEEQLALLSEAFKPVVKAYEKVLLPTITEIAKEVVKIGKRIMYEYPNKRVVHLALHGKRHTREKNMRRIMKWLQEADNGREQS